MSIDYKSSGVDVEKGDAFVDWIQTRDQGPYSDRVLAGVGGFASVFDIKFPEYKDPCIVSATDGVGTKLKIACEFNQYQGIGQDLVAMCVNDLVCCGGKPLFFLDYFATGKLDLTQAKSFLTGVREACHKVGARLIGGETAEMPGIYQGNDFDCAGFAVGIVDKSKILGSHLVKEGSHVIGISSSGFHSNGYSLLRKVFENDMSKWKDKLLIPTELYVNLVLDLHQAGLVQAVAHITGGGMENIPRVFPDELQLELKAWELPELFQEVKKRTKLSLTQMLKTLNCGIGLALIVGEQNKIKVLEIIKKYGYQSFDIGILKTKKTPESIIYPED